MSNINQLYTLGIWTVKPGKEKEFITEWTSFAKWSAEKFGGPGKPHLLQDLTNSLRFISFGPWDDEATIQQWRGSNEFKNFVTKVKEICSEFQPNTLREVAASPPGPLSKGEGERTE